MRALIAALALPMVAACGSPQKTLIVSTVPEGAILVESGSGQQYLAPVELRYDVGELHKHRDANGCFQVRPFTVVWASGTKLEPPAPISLCGERDSWTMTVQRPPEAPGLEKDLWAAEARLRQLEEAQIRHSDAMLNIMAMGLMGAAQGYAAAQERQARAAAELYADDYGVRGLASHPRATTCTPRIGPAVPWSSAPTYDCR